MREIITARFGRSDGLVLASSLISSYSGTECLGGAVHFACRSTLYFYRSLSLLNAAMVGLVSEWWT